MFSGFQYFETKQLSLAGFCYVVTMALLCALYFIADRTTVQFDKNTLYSAQSRYWVSYEWSDYLKAQDIHLNLAEVVSNLDMSSVSYILNCQQKNCELSFIPLNTEGKEVAFSALQQMRHLSDVSLVYEE